MNTLIILSAIISLALSAPVDQIVEVKQDTHGNYRFFYKTAEATRTEEGKADGSVVGSISYVDDHGVTQTLHYTSGVAGYNPVSSLIPVADPTVPEPIKELPEVAHARFEHLNTFENVRSQLPVLRSDYTVEEKPEVPLSRAEFLAAISSVLQRQTPLASAFLADTPEIAEAKAEHLKAQAIALGL